MATGVAWRLSKAGFAIVVTELASPLTVRRTVALSSAVLDGEIDVEGMIARRANDTNGALAIARSGEIAVLVSPGLIDVGADVVVDARMAKRNIDTSTSDASLVIALGPGFVAGEDCHVVIETMRGSRLGRALWDGAAIPNTGVPGAVAGRGSERVLRAQSSGKVIWQCEIGDGVSQGQELGQVGEAAVLAPFDGIVRGLLKDGLEASVGLKIGDVDPRSGIACNEISDKALAIGGGVTEAVLTWQNRLNSTR